MERAFEEPNGWMGCGWPAHSAVAASAKNRRLTACRRNSHRQIEIHLYHPREDCGGALGMLDFGRQRIVQLAEQGFRDAAAHDCERQGCLNISQA